MHKKAMVTGLFQLSIILIFMVIFTTGASGEDVSKKRQEILIAGGSAGGFTALLAEGCAEAIRRNMPKWSVTSTIGEVASSIKLVNDGEMELSVGALELIGEANKGSGIYKGNPLPNVKMMVAMIKEVTQFVLLDKFPVNSIKEWKQKQLPLRLNFQKIGSGAEVRNRRLLNAYGITYADLKSWGCTIRHEGGTSSINYIRDGMLDGSLYTGIMPNAALIELGRSRKMKILPIEADIINDLVDQGKCVKTVIRAGTYNWQTKDIPSAAYVAGIAASTKLEPGVVKAIIQAFIDRIDYLRSLHKSLKSLTIEKMADIPAELMHPEAREYFQSRGIDIK